MANYNINQIHLGDNNYILRDTTSGYATISQITNGNITNTVTQNNNTSNEDYRILLSATANNNNLTETTKKSGNLTYNPSTKIATIGSSTSNAYVQLIGNGSSDAGGVQINSSGSRYQSGLGSRYLRMKNSGEDGINPDTNVNDPSKYFNSYLTASGLYASDTYTYSSSASHGFKLTRTEGLEMIDSNGAKINLTPTDMTFSDDANITATNGLTISADTKIKTYTELGNVTSYNAAGTAISAQGLGVNLSSTRRSKLFAGYWNVGDSNATTNFRATHYSAITNSDGSPGSAYLDSQSVITPNGLHHYEYSALNTISSHSQMGSNIIQTMNTNNWSDSTLGIRLNGTQGQIALRAGSSTSAIISPTKIDDWDSHSVQQTNTVSLSNNYPIIFAGSANSTTESTNVRKNADLTYNPNTKLITLGGSTNSNYTVTFSGNITSEDSFNTIKIVPTGKKRESHMGPYGFEAFDSDTTNTPPNISGGAGSVIRSFIVPKAITTMNSSAWVTTDSSPATSGVRLNSSGTIEVRNGSTTSSTITKAKIDNWDSHIANNSSVTAQTTQAVYPIKIDAQGHISAYGSAVTNIVQTTATQTLTNKTLSTPTINNPTLSNVESSLTFSAVTSTTSPSDGGGMRLIHNTITAGDTLSYTRLGSSASYIIFIFGSSASHSGLYMVHGNNACKTISASDQCTITPSTTGGALTIQNTGTNAVQAYFLRLTH